MKKKKVLISHYNKNDQHIKELKKLLTRRHGYQLKDDYLDNTNSNQSPSVEEIKKRLLNRIQWSDTVLVLIGPKYHTEQWVNWEIEQAHKEGKDIIGVFVEEAKSSDTPENLKKYGDALIEWDLNKIKEAIEGEYHDWENPDGSPWENEYEVERSTC